MHIKIERLWLQHKQHHKVVKFTDVIFDVLKYKLNKLQCCHKSVVAPRLQLTQPPP